jgi:hypothetical protein
MLRHGGGWHGMDIALLGRRPTAKVTLRGKTEDTA